MNELETLSKVVIASGGAAGGTALLFWVLTRPHVLDAFHKLGEWWIRLRAQSADLIATKTRLLIEQEVALNNEQRLMMAALQQEVKDLRVEVADWMAREHDCRAEVHSLRNDIAALMHQNRMMSEQNQALSEMADKGAALLRNLERNHPEWFK